MFRNVEDLVSFVILPCTLRAFLVIYGTITENHMLFCSNALAHSFTFLESSVVKHGKM